MDAVLGGQEPGARVQEPRLLTLRDDTCSPGGRHAAQTLAKDDQCHHKAPAASAHQNPNASARTRLARLITASSAATAVKMLSP